MTRDDLRRLLSDESALGLTDDQFVLVASAFCSYEPPRNFDPPNTSLRADGAFILGLVVFKQDSYVSTKAGNIRINWRKAAMDKGPGVVGSGVGLALSAAIHPIAAAVTATMLALSIARATYCAVELPVPRDAALVLISAWNSAKGRSKTTFEDIKEANVALRAELALGTMSDKELTRNLRILALMDSLRIRGNNVDLLEQVSKDVH